MGGKSGQDPAYAPASTPDDFAYLDMYPDVAESGMNPYYHYVKYGINEGRIWGQPVAMPEFDFEGIIEAISKQREEYTNTQNELNQQYALDAERAAGLLALDEAFSTKLDAANRAIEDVNTQIAEETAHAQTRGLDYSVDEAQKQERIDNMFADYWSESSDAQFNDLYSKWGAGNKQYDWTLNVKRGTAASSKGALPKEGDKVGGKVARGAGATVLTDDEEATDKTLLGA